MREQNWVKNRELTFLFSFSGFNFFIHIISKHLPNYVSCKIIYCHSFSNHYEGKHFLPILICFSFYLTEKELKKRENPKFVHSSFGLLFCLRDCLHSPIAVRSFAFHTLSHISYTEHFPVTIKSCSLMDSCHQRTKSK